MLLGPLLISLHHPLPQFAVTCFTFPLLCCTQTHQPVLQCKNINRYKMWTSLFGLWPVNNWVLVQR